MSRFSLRYVDHPSSDYDGYFGAGSALPNDYDTADEAVQALLDRVWHGAGQPANPDEPGMELFLLQQVGFVIDEAHKNCRMVFFRAALPLEDTHYPVAVVVDTETGAIQREQFAEQHVSPCLEHIAAPCTCVVH
jgi:hypothetical protein